MSKAAQASKRSSGPAVFRFTARLFPHPNASKAATWALLDLPASFSKKLPARGSAKVDGTINDHPFRASAEPNSSGGHWLCVNRAMRHGARAATGDTVALAILEPEPEPKLPADLRAALADSAAARALWKDLTAVGRSDYIHWIEGTNNPDTRARRVRRSAEQLAEGKRRPCCVDVYSFMLCRVQGNGRRRASSRRPPRRKPA